MLDRIIQSSIRHRGLVMVFVLALAALGAWNFTRLAIDAVPDITNVQVAINTSAPGYTPLEVEQRITFPLENAMAGLPRLDHTRSVSRYGLSQVTVVFDEGTDIYFARQLVTERLIAARSALPDGIDPVPGPIATGLGEIFMCRRRTRRRTRDAPAWMQMCRAIPVQQARRTSGAKSINRHTKTQYSLLI